MKVISIIGKKKSGKTSLIEYLIPYLNEYGKVGCIKHAHELNFDFGLDFDTSTAKDTDRFFNAGAEVVIGTSEEKAIKICRRGKTVTELLTEMAQSDVDFVLVEGFKSSNLPKITLSEFLDDDLVDNIIKKVGLPTDSEDREETIKEIVKLILSLDEY
ncbi:molybdopterin-guanine dinucleotide biosynthesis protein B [Methanophagales archaeon]|nr:MAG: molybdopterin-guanine dinucleotide biosynthesis protein B [Methanophagales archaeon]